MDEAGSVSGSTRMQIETVDSLIAKRSYEENELRIQKRSGDGRDANKREGLPMLFGRHIVFLILRSLQDQRRGTTC